MNEILQLLVYISPTNDAYTVYHDCYSLFYTYIPHCTNPIHVRYLHERVVFCFFWCLN